MTWLGIDIGTSAVKAVLIGEDQQVLGAHSEPLSVSRPQDGWSEQAPADWWVATLACVDALHDRTADAIAALKGIGLSGQMHGAVLLDAADQVLRPAILWNDGRSAAQCDELERRCPALADITGNRAMPGFTAPKLLWVAEHEPDIFDKLSKVLLPKDYMRLCLCGEHVSEPSDAAGTLWLDTGARRWSAGALAACRLREDHMPRLVEGSEVSGRLRGELCRRWGTEHAPVIAGGGGDNAAGAVGIGAIAAGDAFLSLGTSGVFWATTEDFRPAPERGVHAFCHAVPATWHQMGVILSAASALSWLARLLKETEETLLSAIERPSLGNGAPLFQPYLTGERTPHNDAQARAGFAGLSHASGTGDLALAVLEGVAFAFRDCRDALASAGTAPQEAFVIGGGSRARLWVEILASVLGMPLHRIADGETGAAFGAARLGAIAATGAPPDELCAKPDIVETIAPDPALVDAYTTKHARYRRLYPALKEVTG